MYLLGIRFLLHYTSVLVGTHLRDVGEAEATRPSASPGSYPRQLLSVGDNDEDRFQGQERPTL